MEIKFKMRSLWFGMVLLCSRRDSGASLRMSQCLLQDSTIRAG